MNTLGLNVPSFPSFVPFPSFENRSHITKGTKRYPSQFLPFPKEFPGIPPFPRIPSDSLPSRAKGKGTAEKEFEAYKAKALEREQKVRRELQDELNKQKYAAKKTKK